MINLNIVEESPVSLLVNGNKHTTFMCTLNNLAELAVGYLHSSRGCDPAQIESVVVSEDRKTITVKMNGYIGEAKDLSVVLSSSSGSGNFSQDFLCLPANDSDFKIELDRAVLLAKEMFESAALYKKHGGIHISAVSDGKKMLTSMEDVGRHNSVDKVIGYALMNEIDLTKSCLITSGRAAADMILKAVNARIPIVVSRSIPTTLAYEIAVQKGVTVLGKILKDKEIFTHPHRVAVS